jgi:hypothetical protein
MARIDSTGGLSSAMVGHRGGEQPPPPHRRLLGGLGRASRPRKWLGGGPHRRAGHRAWRFESTEALDSLFRPKAPPRAVRRSDSCAGSLARLSAILGASDDLQLSVGGKRLPARV